MLYLQFFEANSDIFDAEIDSDVNEDGGHGDEEDEFDIENGGDCEDNSDDGKPVDDSGNEKEEHLDKIKEKKKKGRVDELH